MSDEFILGLFEKSVLGMLLFMFVHFFLNKFSNTLAKVSETMISISNTLTSLDKRMELLEQRVSKLEVKQDE